MPQPKTKHEFFIENKKVDDIELSDLINNFSEYKSDPTFQSQLLTLSKETAKIVYKDDAGNEKTISLQDYEKSKNQFAYIIEKFVIKGNSFYLDSIDDQQAEKIFQDYSKGIIPEEFKNAELGAEFTVTLENYEEPDEKIKNQINKYIKGIVDWIRYKDFTLEDLEELTSAIDGVYYRLVDLKKYNEND